MLDVREQQLLMLLLVIEAKRDKKRNIGVFARGKQFRHFAVNVFAIVDNLVECRPRQQSATRPGMHLAGRIVIRVEQEIVIVVQATIVFGVLLENESFELRVEHPAVARDVRSPCLDGDSRK